MIQLKDLTLGYEQRTLLEKVSAHITGGQLVALLGDEHEAYDKPDFIGIEVTGDKRFYNSHLLSNPFALWRHTLPEEYR